MPFIENTAPRSQTPPITASTSLLHIRNLSCQEGGVPLFVDIDLDVSAGECAVILGPSGSGKSTLLDRIVHGAHRCQGTIQFDREHTALLTQDGSLLDHLSALENLRLVQRFQRKSRTKNAQAVLRQLNIDDSLHGRLASTLSGGERRRVAIARALVREPRLLLFDEPDTGLDSNNIRELASAVRQLVADQACGVVIVTHNPWFAALTGQKVYELFEGRLHLVREWTEFVPLEDSSALSDRRSQLEDHLHADDRRRHNPVARKATRSWALLELVKSVLPYLKSLLPLSRSYLDYFRVFGRTYYISFVTGALFFLLVGGMLGATTIAVVKVLTHNALSGFLKYILTPKVILKIINGSYIVYLVPALGAVLFVARSGSIMTSWLGSLVLGRQTRALSSLGVDPDRYLRGPVIWTLWLAYLCTALVFGIGMWIGSVTTAEYLFQVGNAAELLRFPEGMVWQSLLHYKVAIYGVFLTFFITGFGFAPKVSTEAVALHTTKAIIYTTVAISLTELLFALDMFVI